MKGIPKKLCAASALLILAGCGAGPGGDLETRTFRVEHLDVDAAVSLIEPYVFSEGAAIHAANGGVPAFTVRERGEILDRVATTLAEYDRPAPRTVTLRFQVIEADGFETPDPAIADVETALRSLFRFRGYRLAAEAVVTAARFGDIRQRVADIRNPRRHFILTGKLLDVRAGSDGGRARLQVHLLTGSDATVLSTTLDIPIGETVVIGSGQPHVGSRTLILAVRPELAR